jgi:hypothetical protein
LLQASLYSFSARVTIPLRCTSGIVPLALRASLHLLSASVTKNPGRVPVLPGFSYKGYTRHPPGQAIFLEVKSQPVDNHVIIFDIIGINTSLEVITSPQISAAQHIGQIIGDFVGTGNIKFPAIITVVIVA